MDGGVSGRMKKLRENGERGRREVQGPVRMEEKDLEEEQVLGEGDVGILEVLKDEGINIEGERERGRRDGKVSEGMEEEGLEEG